MRSFVCQAFSSVDVGLVIPTPMMPGSCSSLPWILRLDEERLSAEIFAFGDIWTCGMHFAATLMGRCMASSCIIIIIS